MRMFWSRKCPNSLRDFFIIEYAQILIDGSINELWHRFFYSWVLRDLLFCFLFLSVWNLTLLFSIDILFRISCLHNTCILIIFFIPSSLSFSHVLIEIFINISEVNNWVFLIIWRQQWPESNPFLYGLLPSECMRVQHICVSFRWWGGEQTTLGNYRTLLLTKALIRLFPLSWLRRLPIDTILSTATSGLTFRYF